MFDRLGYPKTWAACAAILLPAWSQAVGGGFPEWAGSASIQVNTASDGAATRSPLTGFPLLVRLDRSNFDFSAALGKGQDIRFSKAGSGSPLPHQIERWDSAAGRAEIWVRLDTVRAGSRDQGLRMHWGNPGATDVSDGGAVFDPASGFVGAWHLGGAGTRANAVRGGNPAVPVRYDGDESRPGLIGFADSLEGDTLGEYLDLGDGFEDFSEGFTYSVWAKAEEPTSYAKLLDLGNGPGRDNITLFRVLETDDLALSVWSDTLAGTRVVAPGMADSRVWRHFAVTVSGRAVRLYRDGEPVRADTLAFPIPRVRRTLNYIGESNWASNEAFRGLVDEPVIARTARSPDWIRLAYASQRPGQTVVRILPDAGCPTAFAAPRDTAAAEGSVLILPGRAGCATTYRWSLVEGQGPRILDPDVESLRVLLPRVRGDALLVYRFTADFADGEKSALVRVTVKETRPEPEFRLPAPVRWTGRDTLPLSPALINREALRASGDTVLTFAWTLAGIEVDTLGLREGLRFLNPRGAGEIRVGLCVANGGIPTCDSTRILVDPTLALRETGRARLPADGMQGVRNAKPARDLAGRALKAGAPVRIRFLEP